LIDASKLKIIRSEKGYSFPLGEGGEEEYERKKRTLRDSFVEPTYPWAAERREPGVLS
jgi:hypothetical protein